PQGGITFRLEKVVQKGSSYEAIYHVTVYPSEANLFWLEGIMGLDDIVVTTDVKHIDKEEAKDSIGNSIEEYLNRAYTEKKERGRVDASLEYNEIKDLYELVSKNKEVMKRIILRLFITSPTIHDLEQRIRDVQTSIETEGFQA
ncbi:type VI secretion protein, partial [Listeria monocytogenes]|nr:type VI secretion protein [Listeria monocytogenes]